MWALKVKSKFAGFSSSSLENAYYFAHSTTAMSPLTISTATPTAVMGTTTNSISPKSCHYITREQGYSGNEIV
jgi:hypothetical protein